MAAQLVVKITILPVHFKPLISLITGVVSGFTGFKNELTVPGTIA
jgi:hypothetical protein